MSWLQAVIGLVLVLVLPFVLAVAQHYQQEWSKTARRWVCIVASIVAGIATALLGGIPTPDTFVLWVFAGIGGVQTSYAAYKAIGITVGWLDALEGVKNAES
ncbi:MAG: hypothetical protein LBR39_02945 [Coriobacteriales bacterium]|jgi:H+/gluconate symporter-like permease|nr:hypothetical protein [Coriobacteriales bacterium]